MFEKYPNIKVFLVGGAVRDSLMGRTVKDHDFVVVHATSEQMVEAGFQQVGADFPVFLDSRGREFALARQERKVGSGYHGFEVDFNPSVTLKDDLYRRDLTINTLAQEVVDWDSNGDPILSQTIIDYFGGMDDLHCQELRHVSDAFAEDPLRVLRVARFRARYNFTIAEETVQLMVDIVNQGEMEKLTAERVWLEMEKAMGEPYIFDFFKTLDNVGVIDRLMPELKNVIFLKNQIEELCFGEETDQATKVASIVSSIFEDEQKVVGFWTRMKAPNHIIKNARVFWILSHSMRYGVTAKEAFEMLKKVDVLRQPDLVKENMSLLVYLMEYSFVASYVSKMINAVRAITSVRFEHLTTEEQSLKGPEIGKAMDRLRLEQIENIFNDDYVW